VVLRCADADEHAVCGAPRGLFDRRAPAGRGWWGDLHLQVLDPAMPLPAPRAAPAPLWQPAPDRDAIIIARRVDDVAERLAASHLPHRVVLDVAALDPLSIASHDRVELDPRILLATPAQWQASWSLLSAARAHVPIMIVECDPSEVRSLLGHREPLPPLDVTRDEIWLVESSGTIRRAAWSRDNDPTDVRAARPRRES
jgi:hypothetical protein